MNTDIRLSVGFWSHPKVKRLAKCCGLEGVRSLQVLWLWAAQNRPDGNLHGMDSLDIELAADWAGEDGAFASELAGRFLDGEEGHWILHDWAEHNPWAAGAPERSAQAKAAADARWKRRNGENMHSACSQHATSTNQHAHSNAPLPSPSPEETSLNSKVLPQAEGISSSTRSASAPSKPGAARTKKPADHTSPETGYRTRKGRTLDGKRLDAFERFWSAYGYAKGKAEAADAWLDIPQLTEALVARIVSAAEREAAARPALIASGRTPKMAQGWITARRWEDGDEPVPRVMSAAQQRLESNKAAGDEFLRMVQQQEAGHAR